MSTLLPTPEPPMMKKHLVVLDLEAHAVEDALRAEGLFEVLEGNHPPECPAVGRCKTGILRAIEALGMGFSATKRSSRAWLAGSFAVLSSVLARRVQLRRPRRLPPSSSRPSPRCAATQDQAREFQCEAPSCRSGPRWPPRLPLSSAPWPWTSSSSAYSTSSTLARFDRVHAVHPAPLFAWPQLLLQLVLGR